jgi:hypothetical protein
MRKELIKPSKDSKIRLTSNRVLCIPFFLLLGAYMLFGAAMTPLSPMEESYKVMETIESYIGIAICVYVCIYSLVSITQKDTPVIKKYLCFLLLVTGIIGFFYLRSGFLYFDLVMIISLICATQESEKVNPDNDTVERVVKRMNAPFNNDSI